MSSLDQLFSHAIQLHQAGQVSAARDLYNHILLTHPDHPDVLNNLALAHHQLGTSEIGLPLALKALPPRKDRAEFWNTVGLLLSAVGRVDEAIPYYEKATQLNVTYAQAWINLGVAYNVKKDFDRSIACQKRALHLTPNDYSIWNNLGVVYGRMSQLVQTEHAYGMALKLRPNEPVCLFGLGCVLTEMGRYQEAIEASTKAIRFSPNYAEAHVNLGVNLLRLGNYQEGLPEYEWRLKLPSAPNIPAGQRWDGTPMPGKTLYVYQEQGLGDGIHFLRYVPIVAAMEMHVIIGLRKPLIELAASVVGATQVVDLDETPPEFDFHLPLMSLPYALKTIPETIPHRVPYLSVPKEMIDQFAQAVASDPNLKIGLSWAGARDFSSDHVRSVKLAAFAPFANLNGVTFYNLQKGPGSEELNSPPPGLKIIDIPGANENLQTTGAFIQNLDLVICVDTSIGHLAGALGKPVWLMLPMVPHWPWLATGDKTAWYPNTSLYRQQKLFDWAPMIKAMTKELALGLSPSPSPGTPGEGRGEGLLP